LRADPPEVIGAWRVEAVRDYQKKESGTTRSSRAVDLPTANVISFSLEQGARVVARPSGTEPKIKFYFDLRETVEDEEPYADARARATSRLDALIESFLELVA
jgi:phosphomannomutase